MGIQLELIARNNHINYSEFLEDIKRVVLKEEKSSITYIDLENNVICLANGKKIPVNKI